MLEARWIEPKANPLTADVRILALDLLFALSAFADRTRVCITKLSLRLLPLGNTRKIRRHGPLLHETNPHVKSNPPSVGVATSCMFSASVQVPCRRIRHGPPTTCLHCLLQPHRVTE
jgi:hypothetical protein